MFDVPNHNNFFTYGTAAEKAGREYVDTVKYGRITNVTRDAHLTQLYDVELMETGGVIVPNCKNSTSQMGFSGVGVYYPLQEGQPVIVVFRNGVLENGTIIGCFSTLGSTDKYYEGLIASIGETVESAYSKQSDFNQPSLHPSRIAQDDAYFHIVGGKTLKGKYESPEYAKPDEQRKTQPIPASIEIRNQGGDVLQYCSGAHITYADGTVVHLSGGTTETKATKLLKIARMHAERASLFSGVVIDAENTNELEAGIQKILQLKPAQNGLVSIDDIKRSKEEVKVALEYLGKAKQEAATAAAQTSEVNRMVEANGSNLQAPQVGEDKTVLPELKLTQNLTNGETETRQPTPYKPILLISETLAPADIYIDISKRDNKAHHYVIRRNGEAVQMVPSNRRSLSLSDKSAFRGESFQGNVSDFAIQVVVESPPKGQGYTTQQYQTLASIVKKEKVDPNRVALRSEVSKLPTDTVPGFNLDSLRQFLR